jgi:hypothetical protein
MIRLPTIRSRSRTRTIRTLADTLTELRVNAVLIYGRLL